MLKDKNIGVFVCKRLDGGYGSELKTARSIGKHLNN